MKKIIFVCEGNTCRSPMAASLLRAKLKRENITDVTVVSRGLSAEDGAPMSEKSKETLRKHKLRAGNFKAKKLAAGECKKVYAVITMTAEQKKAIGEYNVISSYDLVGFDIPDPYGGNLQVYENTFGKIEILCDKIIKELKN